MLNLQVEEAERDVSRLRYVADGDSNLRSRVHVPGYDVSGFATVVKAHTCRTADGRPPGAGSGSATFTNMNMAVSI